MGIGQWNRWRGSFPVSCRSKRLFGWCPLQGHRRGGYSWAILGWYEYDAMVALAKLHPSKWVVGGCQYRGWNVDWHRGCVSRRQRKRKSHHRLHLDGSHHWSPAVACPESPHFPVGLVGGSKSGGVGTRLAGGHVSSGPIRAEPDEPSFGDLGNHVRIGFDGCCGWDGYWGSAGLAASTIFWVGDRYRRVKASLSYGGRSHR